MTKLGTVWLVLLGIWILTQALLFEQNARGSAARRQADRVCSCAVR